ncbi:HAD family hydrolase [Microbacterium sediminis]|nr:HAD family phosphatase [Microbacterium sediminis]QBR75470.1 HAD family phosphatase [Microbacterium sediminis]
MTPQAVLWDMDGTLVDSEPYWIAAETELIASYGGTWTHEDAMQLIGLGLFDSAAIIQARGVDMTPEEIVDHLTAQVVHRLRTDGVPFRPGARELLFSLREAGVKTALVTMSMHRMARTVVDLIDFPAFDLIVGGDDVERPKPFPDPYLHAAQTLGVDIRACVALEDSPNGLRSAIASGAVALGVENLLPLEGLGAAAVWRTLAGSDAEALAALFREHRAPQQETTR